MTTSPKESKTKEQILGEGGDACEYNWELHVIPYDTALTAMNQYAAQQNSSLLEALKTLLTGIEYAAEKNAVYAITTQDIELIKDAIQNAENQNNNP